MTTNPTNPPPPPPPAGTNPPPSPMPQPVVVRPAPWHRRWRISFMASGTTRALTIAGVALGTLVALAILLSLNVFRLPTTAIGRLWWVSGLVVTIAIVLALGWLLYESRVGLMVVIVVAILLFGPFLVGLFVSGARAISANIDLPPPAPTVTVAPVTVTPTVTAPTVTVAPTEPAPTSDEPAPYPPQTVTVPPVPTDEPEPSATTAPMPVSINTPSGAVGRIFQLSGTGDIPEGMQLLVFVYAPVDGRYFPDGPATPRSGHQWVLPAVYVGSTDACNNGKTFTVTAVLVDGSVDGANSIYTRDQWISKFGRFQRDSVSVTRAGTAPINKC